MNLEDIYGRFKWEIIVSDKPRGLWRPKLKVRLWNTKIDNGLAILTQMRSEDWSRRWGIEVPELGCSIACKTCKSNITNILRRLECPGPLIVSDKKKHYDECKLEICGFINLLKLSFFHQNSYEFRLEWRPGKPDYSDYVDWFETFILVPALETYQARLSEAYQSLPLDQIERLREGYDKEIYSKIREL